MDGKQKRKLIMLAVAAILLVIGAGIGVTYAFMSGITKTNSVTEITISNCAKIGLSDITSVINMDNAYPMSRNAVLANPDLVKPYAYSVSSNCDTPVSYTLYLGVPSDSTLTNNIRYIITRHGKKTILNEGMLKDANIVTFDNQELTQFKSGTGLAISTIYELFNADVPLGGGRDYDLYLFLDAGTTLTSSDHITFTAGVAVKSFDRLKANGDPDYKALDVLYSNSEYTDCTRLDCALDELMDLYESVPVQEEE